MKTGTQKNVWLTISIRLGLILALLAGLLSSVLATPAHAAATTWTVTSLADSGAGSLRKAIADAVPGDTIIFDISLSGRTIPIISTLTIDKNLTIDGSALKTRITLSGENTVRIFLVDAGKTVSLKSLKIANGYMNGEGGGIYNDGTLTVTNSLIANNNAFFGGGIHNNGSLTVTNSTFSANSATQYGGGIESFGPLTVTNSTFSANVAAFGGGIDSSSTLTVTNSTFSGNNASSNGGGIHVYTSGTLTVTNSTFSYNSAAVNGGGIFNAGTLNFVNTILSNATSGEDCYTNTTGTIGTNLNNLVMNNAASPKNCGTSILTSDPNLGPLSSNGGLTQTFALLADSPAIDAGDDATCDGAQVNKLDQRGVTRPQGAHCDIGAYEYDSTLTLTPPLVTASDGTNLDAVQVSWNASNGATSYLVYRSEGLDGPKIPTKGYPVTGLNGVDLWAVPGMAYYYWVKACKADLCSDFSAGEPGWRGFTPPVVTASDGTYSDKVLVSWTASIGATSYIAYRSTSPDGVKIPANGFVTAQLSGDDLWAAPGLSYYYWVKACNSSNCSDLSIADIGWR